jgi:hypothetical protein
VGNITIIIKVEQRMLDDMAIVVSSSGGRAASHHPVTDRGIR